MAKSSASCAGAHSAPLRMREQASLPTGTPAHQEPSPTVAPTPESTPTTDRSAP
ncbi:hypothetical protein M5E87_23705 [Flavonifractor plautii]|nr:hypothetical protein M5E87_23705 [Flavonifractor plautii]